MALPPFPSQEVAKLVLGYLAEEHLMTAYDEFLQASPYLDAFRNEYGRVFMTSLKNILAEYMAVKIYVESCKPISLRRKLMECTNLLEVVKLLVALVDVQKANFQDTEKPRIYKPNVISKGNNCDICSLNYANCSCHTSFSKKQVCETEVITESAVEATSLADLPGNAVIQEDNQKNVSSVVYSVQRCQLNSSENNLIQCADNEPSNHVESNINSVTSSTSENSNDVRSMPQPALLTIKPDACRKNVEEFNTILNIVAEQSANSNVPPSKTILNTGNFQEFADGVGGTMKDKEYSSHTPNHPSDPLLYQNNANCIANMGGSTRQMISAPPPGYTYNNEVYTKPSTLNEKNPEQKIKIISDIKVNNSYSKMPPILKCTTSSPLVQMQTLYINGTPAYKNKLQTGSNYSYTKDEIMAMPTIIIVPASGTSKQPQLSVPHTTTAAKKQNVDTITTNSTTSARVLQPLTIDVQRPGSVSDKNIENKDMNLKDIENTNEKGLVKTVDLTTASLPKEASGTSLSKTSTPTVLPPIKKSSSTPRRTSHIRVLDFTTPRRILNENSSEKNVNDSNIPSKALLDLVEERKEISIDENVHTNFRIPHKNSQVDTPLEKKIKPKKKPNWDADLRALIGPSDSNVIELTKKTPVQNKNVSKNCLKNEDIPKVKSINKSKPTNSIQNRKEKSTAPPKRTKKKIKTEKKTDDSNLATVKPTINIITTNSETPPQENNNKQCLIDNDTEQADTPEAERLALQNVIGAKLNISDLLETPYKQAIYDIQMETPRFLGPDLPDEPMSDIKIMNIPTPRFFDTPKITQATPSSYSSRQTDYSSGGSYYKPDDQDYIPIAEVLECAIRIEKIDEENSLSEVHERSRRPVRKCTKNVSYRKSSNQNNKVKEEMKPNRNSISNDVNSPFVLDKNTNKKKSRATPSRKIKSKESSSECEPSKKDTEVSPLKIETQNQFMKIKPRKTQIKESSAKRNRKLSDSSKQLFYNETQSKKRTIKDTKTASASTAIAAAPTKSRRKSATPRKLHCTKSFNADSGEHNLPDLSKRKEDVSTDIKVLCPQDSDTEQPPLRWSDDGSQEDKSKDIREITYPQNEEDDIDNIKKYIENCSKSDGNKDKNNKDSDFDLKRSFDAETAKIIERDLLDTPPRLTQPPVMEIAGVENKQLTEVTVSNNSESANLDNDESDESKEEEEVELSVCDCNEDSKNYFSYTYDETKFTQNNDLAKLKDKFCMELCMEDGVSIRLNATTISTLFEQDPGDFVVDECYFNETVTAVSSISNIEKLYTPMKDVRNQCIEIFDSTLTSLDTPLKVNSPKERQQDAPLTEIVLEIENIQYKENTDTKRRKRNQSCVVDESVQSTKKLKSETQELLKSANIQNMDIESVLSKLHGP